MSGPLTGFRVIELAGIGAGPFCGMMLGDMGAEVISIERPGGNPAAAVGHSVLFRNRRSVALNLKRPEAVQAVLRLCEKADALFEANRAGVAERLGVGPEACLARNPRLVYGRMTGWGQDGPLAQTAGHDINYISIAGVLHAIGRRGEAPAIPLNLVGDFGGGGLLLAFGMVCALLEASRTGKGQVVDAAMVDGASALMAMWWGFKQQGAFAGPRGTHLLDSGAHFYEVYETSDGQHLAIGAIEPQFYAQLRDKLGLGADFNNQMDARRWPEMKEKLTAVIRGNTRDHWCALFEGSDACVAPVLSLDEAAAHPHNRARQAFLDVAGTMQPAPAPRFSRTPAATPRAQGKVGADTAAALAEFGFSPAEIEAVKRGGTT
ncbi:MAG: CoA transferase [Hydrocarboniphaga effusa]|nr:CoA transferase [Hydrocarboniphaga effusa]